MKPLYASVHHDGSPRYVRSPSTGGLHLNDAVTIRLRMARELPVERVLLRICPDGEQEFIEMSSEADDDPACRWWQARLPLTMPSNSYRFLLFTAEDGALWYNGEGLHRHVPTDAADFRLLADYQSPNWVTGSVFYQIFPDRFADGDPTNNVRDGEFSFREYRSIARSWGASPAAGGWQSMLEFFGGDLQGIRRRLDYLEELGVNALYLNPVFTAYSNHRYDVVDYHEVDPHLGGNQALVDLRRATRERGLRYLLDIVPNHCGRLHPWFLEAQADPSASTADYFTFFEHPDSYASWLGVRGLPKLNYRSGELRRAMYAGPEAVFRRWLRPPFQADGWRVDVANMLGRQGPEQYGLEVGREIRNAVKEENPQAYLLGENFFDPTAQLQGDIWDAVMNYSGFTLPLWYWLSGFRVEQHGHPSEVRDAARWPTQALADTWQVFRSAIPWAVARQQFNLLGSHDTDRILTVVGGDPALNRLAVGLLMTYPGVPSIYYGDEVGLAGAGLHARRCMEWKPSRWDAELRGYYQALIRLRRSSPALREGGFQMLQVESDSLAFLRDSDEEQILVMAHRGPAERPAGDLHVAHGAIPDGRSFREALSGGRATVSGGRLPVPAMPPGIAVWRSE